VYPPPPQDKQDYRNLENQPALNLLKKYEQEPFWDEYKETKDLAQCTKENILAHLGT
jgi:hypothetical protein